VNAKRVASEDEAGVPHPRETTLLVGHREAERELLDAYRGGRMPHAWLIGGPAGIGKATLAYRMARFVLAHPRPDAEAVLAASTLDVPPDHPVARRIAVRGHSDLLAIERRLNDSGTKLRTEIAVDDVRRMVPFFGSTAGEGGWRICVVDSVDELNASGANALLKVVEEPPTRSLLLLVSHAPGRALPTIRSRCRRLTLRALSRDEVIQAAAAALDVQRDDEGLVKAADLSDGSVARAIALYDGPAMAIHERVTGLLARLPHTEPQALHALGDNLGRADEIAFDAFQNAVRDWLSGQIARGGSTRRLARAATAWEAFNQAADDTDTFNLDRKPLVFTTFGLLAEVARD
jgi:DNA polymerase-3 subunit delta'